MTQAAAAVPPRYRARRTDAAFLAQMIATAEDLPQTRARRQCSAGEGARAYAAVAQLVALA